MSAVKVTIIKPPPQPPKRVVLEMTEEEAHALKDLLGECAIGCTTHPLWEALHDALPKESRYFVRSVCETEHVPTLIVVRRS